MGGADVVAVISLSTANHGEGNPVFSGCALLFGLGVVLYALWMEWRDRR